MNNHRLQQEEEKVIFDLFIRLQPTFVGELITDWQPAEVDPPDIVCTTASGRTVGVELVEWLHSGEMKAAKSREAIDQKLLDAMGAPQPLNTSNHFDMVILHPQEQVRIEADRERLIFRRAVLSLIADVDRRWPTESSWHYADGYRERNLAQWPPLDQYLKEVQFHPGQEKWKEGINWILPPVYAGFFDDGTMVAALADLISNKIRKYRERPIATSCDEFVLLAYFSQGAMYNSPIQTPRRRIEACIDEVRLKLSTDHGEFVRAYLLLALLPDERLFQLW